MEFEATLSNLNNCLNNVVHFTDKGTQLDITKNIKLKTDKNILEFSATNLKISIVERLQGSCKKEGEVIVPAILFKSCIQNLTSFEARASNKRPPKVNIKLDDNKIVIKYKKTTSVINTYSGEFPEFPQSKKTKPILAIKAEVLRHALMQTVFAANKDISRPILNGVYLHIFEGSWYLVATDSYRLAEKRLDKILSKVPNVSKDAEQCNALIPASSLMILERILKNKPQEDVNVYYIPEKKHIFFVVGKQDIEISSSLQDTGNYPNYRQLLPKTPKTTVKVNRQDLIDAARRVDVFTGEMSSILFSCEKKRQSTQSLFI